MTQSTTERSTQSTNTAQGTATLPKPRIGTHPGFSRVVFDLQSTPVYRVEALGPALRLTLPSMNTTPVTAKVTQAELSGYMLENKVEKGATMAVVTLITPQGVSSRAGWRTSILPAANGVMRLVIDLSRAFADVTPLGEVAPFKWTNGAGKPFSVLLDPGHGGSDPGALGFAREAELVLDLTKRVRTRLEQAGVSVMMTREGNNELAADKTSDLAARAGMSAGYTAFVSIHANAAPKTRAEAAFGTEVYYFGPTSKPLYPAPGPNPMTITPTQPATPVISPINTPTTENPSETSTLPSEPTAPLELVSVEGAPQASELGLSLGTILPSMPETLRLERSQHLATHVLSSILGSTASYNRGVRTAPFYVIKYAPVPAILVEIGYVTHPVEGEALQNTNYLDRLAYGISRGILEHLDQAASADD